MENGVSGGVWAVCACKWDQMFVYDRHVACLLLKTGSLPDRTLNMCLHRVSILLESIAPIIPNNHWLSEY